MKKYLNITGVAIKVICLITCSVPSMYSMQLDLVEANPEQEPSAVQFDAEERTALSLDELSGKAQKIKPEELARNSRPLIKPSYNNEAWCQKNLRDMFQQNYQGDAESRRAFYKTAFRQIKPEGLERERKLHVQQTPEVLQEESGDDEEKVQAEQASVNQQQEHPIGKAAGFRFQMRQMDGLPGVAVTSASGKQVFAPFSGGGERGIAHVMGEEHFPVAPRQDIMDRVDMEHFHGEFSVTGERDRYIPRNGTSAEMTKYLLS